MSIDHGHLGSGLGAEAEAEADADAGADADTTLELVRATMATNCSLLMSDLAIANNSNVITEENYYLLRWLYRIRRVSCARGIRVGFLQPDFLWSIYRPMMRSKKRWRSNGDIKVAANLWCSSNRAAAEERYGHISAWDVSSVTDMSDLFKDMYKFDDDISRWDVSNVTNMNSMFYEARKFNQPIGDWDVSKVTDMKGMFSFASAFNQPIGDWDVSNVTTMLGMFLFAQAFNQPVGNWDMSKVTKTGTGIMFHTASAMQSDNKPASLR